MEVKNRPEDGEIEAMYAKIASRASVSEEELSEILIDLENEGISRSFKSQFDTRRGNGGIYFGPGSSYLDSKGMKLINAINRTKSDVGKS